MSFIHGDSDGDFLRSSGRDRGLDRFCSDGRDLRKCIVIDGRSGEFPH